MGLKTWLADLTASMFPRLCEVCGRPLTRGEEIICLECLAEMPRCRFHRLPFNRLHEKLADPNLLIDRAAALFYYTRGNAWARLLQKGKYDNQPQIFSYLGRLLAREIRPDGFFDGIDLIVPVPLHPSKLRRRGYNQSLVLAQAVSEVTGIPIAEPLEAYRHETQTRRSAVNRWLNAKDVYTCPDGSALAGRHLLVVDDIVTTGATVRACCRALLGAEPTVRLSVLSVGVTSID